MVSDACCPMAGQLVSGTCNPTASDLYNCDCPTMYTGLNCDGKWCMLSYDRSTSKWYICYYG